MTKNTIDRQYTEGVELYCQLLLEKISYLREVVNRGMAFIRGTLSVCPLPILLHKLCFQYLLWNAKW